MKKTVLDRVNDRIEGLHNAILESALREQQTKEETARVDLDTARLRHAHQMLLLSVARNELKGGGPPPESS